MSFEARGALNIRHLLSRTTFVVRISQTPMTYHAAIIGPVLRECNVTVSSSGEQPRRLHTKKLKTVEPGKTYKLKFYPLHPDASIRDIYEFLCEQEAILDNLYPIFSAMGSPEVHLVAKAHRSHCMTFPVWIHSLWPWKWTKLSYLRADVVTEELPDGHYRSKNCLVCVCEG